MEPILATEELQEEPEANRTETVLILSRQAMLFKGIKQRADLLQPVLLKLDIAVMDALQRGNRLSIGKSTHYKHN